MAEATAVPKRKLKCKIRVMQRLDYSPNLLESGIWYGPAQIVLADKTTVESALREEPTTSWKKGWSEHAYDFPNSYVNIPLRVREWNPISTFAENQNTRFFQRYPSAK
jgi:hypothetical protein